jgi:hypothetical protein
MKTFCAVDDAALMGLIASARKRIVFVAPGLTLAVAKVLGDRFKEMDGALDITVVLDADEDVCRIGYGEVAALQALHKLAQKNGFWLKSQPGLRVGVLLADDQTLVWSPTPCSVEAPPASHPWADGEQGGLLDEPAPLAPNGLLLGTNPGAQLAQAIAAEGTDTGPGDAEIGQQAITREQVAQTVEAHAKNPPIPVDLARVTRVFSSKLQFVELKVTKAKLSKSQLSVPSKLLNADVKGELEGLIESKLHAFAELRDEEIEVQAFVNGEAAMDAQGKPLKVKVSEASLERQRKDLEKRFVTDIPGVGHLIEKDNKAEFQKLLNAYKVQLLEHAKGVRDLLDEQSEEILDEALDLIVARSERAPSKDGKVVSKPNPDAIREELKEGLERAKGGEPSMTLVFKDVTYEQTQSEDFRKKLDHSLSPTARRRIGKWTEAFDAAKQRQDSQQLATQKGAN